MILQEKRHNDKTSRPSCTQRNKVFTMPKQATRIEKMEYYNMAPYGCYPHPPQNHTKNHIYKKGNDNESNQQTQTPWTPYDTLHLPFGQHQVAAHNGPVTLFIRGKHGKNTRNKSFLGNSDFVLNDFL
jgi:hypothetical protein